MELWGPIEMTIRSWPPTLRHLGAVAHRQDMHSKVTMTENSNVDNGNDNDSGEDANLKQLREKAKRVDELEAALRQRDRADAFNAAGINVASGIGKLAFDTYTGEDVTPEAIQSHLDAYGIKAETLQEANKSPEATSENSSQTQQPAQQSNPSEQEYFQTQQNLAAGAQVKPDDGDPYVKGMKAFNDEMASGRPREQAASAMIGAIFKGASEGNTDVLYDHDRWMASQGGA